MAWAPPRLAILLIAVAVAAAKPATAYSVRADAAAASIDAFAQADPPRQLIASKQDLLSILTPVYPDEHTLGLLRNQLRTFAAFADISSFAAWVLVAPGDKILTLQMFLDFELPQLPAKLGDKIVVAADEACAPELEPARFASLAFNDAGFVTGWLKQQLLKLACAHLMETPFHLITDADTFYLNPFSAGDLFESAACSSLTHIVCDSRSTESYRARTEMQPYVNGSQQIWIRNSAKTLQLPVPPRDVQQSIGVTPQIMSRPLVAALATHLETLLAAEVWERVTWRAYLVASLTDYFSRPKAEQQRGNTPWTEYNLYWVFARHAGLWDRYHVHGQLQSAGSNAWHSTDFGDWDPCTNSVTDEWNPGYWATVQSVVEVDGKPVSGDAIWDKLAPCVPASNDALGAASDAAAVAAT